MSATSFTRAQSVTTTRGPFAIGYSTHFAMQKAPFMNRGYDPAIEAATEALGPGRYSEKYDEGAGMSVVEATSFLLSR